MNYPNDPHPDYHKMVRKLEREGMTTSDAQGAADVHYAKKAKSTALKKKTKIAPYSTERLPMSKGEYKAYMKDKYGK